VSGIPLFLLAVMLAACEISPAARPTAGVYSSPQPATTTPQSSAVAETITLPEADIVDRLEGGWAGQMIGVDWAAPTEFKAMGRILSESEVPIWTPGMINNGFNQDDIYVEIPFLDALKQNGINASWSILGDSFRSSAFDL